MSSRKKTSVIGPQQVFIPVPFNTNLPPHLEMKSFGRGYVLSYAKSATTADNPEGISLDLVNKLIDTAVFVGLFGSDAQEIARYVRALNNRFLADNVACALSAPARPFEEELFRPGDEVLAEELKKCPYLPLISFLHSAALGRWAFGSKAPKSWAGAKMAKKCHQEYVQVQGAGRPKKQQIDPWGLKMAYQTLCTYIDHVRRAVKRWPDDSARVKDSFPDLDELPSPGQNLTSIFGTKTMKGLAISTVAISYLSRRVGLKPARLSSLIATVSDAEQANAQTFGSGDVMH